MDNKITYYGGRAYYNGVMFFTDRFSVKAVRNKDNTIRFKKYEVDEKLVETSDKIYDVVSRVPIIRGIYSWIVINKVYYTLLPIIALDVLSQLSREYGTGKTFNGFDFVGLIIMAVIFVRTVFFLIKYKAFFSYHGAEHKVSNAYDKNRPLTLQEASKQSRVHERCGTMTIGFFLVSTAVVFLLLKKIISYLSIKYIIIFGVLDELYKNEELKRYGTGYIHKFGGLIQKYITTTEPSEEQLDLAIKCFQRLLVLEKEETY